MGLKDYLRQKGLDLSKNPTHCPNRGAHKNGDADPSFQIFDDAFKCHGCGIQGDIYDAVGLLEGIADKGELYDFVERVLNGGTVSRIESKMSWNAGGGADGKKFSPDPEAMKQLEAFVVKNPAGKEQIKKFLDKRASASVGAASYPTDVESYLIDKFFYWPGLEEVRRYLSNEILKKCGIPLVNPQTGHSTWEHSGVFMRLGTGYKLHYYDRHYCKACKDWSGCRKYKEGGSCEKCTKINSKSGKTLPMPGVIDTSRPVVLVEGEMDALASAGIGIENLFATGGANTLTAPKVKDYLLEVPEIILFFDADKAGRKASGLDPIDENDKHKTSIPQTIRRAGYTGKIRLAELPTMLEGGYKDQDALVLAGKCDIITTAIEAAREWVAPSPAPKKIYTPFEKFNFLTVRRLQTLLKKMDRKRLDKKDVPVFVWACLNAFPHAETVGHLKSWGATEAELYKNPDVSPYDLLPIVERYLSRYLVREIEREITPVDEFLKRIKIQNTKFDLDFDEIEISQNARNFFYTGGIRSAALMLADIFDGKIIFNDAKNDKRFYFYDGHVWRHEPDITGVIYNTLLSVMVRLKKQKKENPGPDDTEDPEKENKRFYATLNMIEDRRFRKNIELEFGGLKAEGVYHNSDDDSDVLHFDGEITRETLTLQDCVLDMSGDKITFRKSLPGEYRKKVLPYTMRQVRDTPVKYFWEFMHSNFKDEKTLETFVYCLLLYGL